MSSLELEVNCVSVVVPCCNEEASIRSVIEKIRTVLPQSEIIVIDDGSTDRTPEFAESAGAFVISHPYQMGNGAAVKAGIRHAKGNRIVLLDGDGQHDPMDIPKLLASLDSGFEMAVGARDKASQASIGRRFANRFYNRFAGIITGHRVEDLTSGFRAARADRLREFVYLLPNGFSYPTTITMSFFRSGYSVAYVPISAARRLGKSHIHPVKDGLRFLLIIFKIATLFSPLKIFVPVAFVMFMVATGWYGYTFSAFGRFTNMSALLYTGSVITFMMGLISEQITALMYKSQK